MRHRDEPDFPTPWTFQQWLEWAEWTAVRALRRGEAFGIAAQASHPNRSRVMWDATHFADPIRTALYHEVGGRAMRELEEVSA